MSGGDGPRAGEARARPDVPGNARQQRALHRPAGHRDRRWSRPSRAWASPTRAAFPAGLAPSVAIMTGISEALVATAIGLFVAIPAVVAYNFFTRRVQEFIGQRGEGPERSAARRIWSAGSPGLAVAEATPAQRAFPVDRASPAHHRSTLMPMLGLKMCAVGGVLAADAAGPARPRLRRPPRTSERRAGRRWCAWQASVVVASSVGSEMARGPATSRGPAANSLFPYTSVSELHRVHQGRTRQEASSRALVARWPQGKLCAPCLPLLLLGQGAGPGGRGAPDSHLHRGRRGSSSRARPAVT